MADILSIPKILLMITFVLQYGSNAVLRVPEGHDPLQVRTKSGFVRGITQITRTGKQVHAFLGIPYAEPPVGNLRFVPPVPINPWKGVFNASTLPDSCLQKILRLARYIPVLRKQLPTTPLNEDCLKLNVWVPRTRPSNSTVVVWIHGGGFTLGSTSVLVQQGDTLAAEENLIVVSLNYRVASLGFLYLNNSAAPGNAGLYDQKLALDWVHDNIAAFGGNPNNVLVMGQSAGAASVVLHAMSGLSDNAFQRIAVLSAPVVPWSVMENDVILSKGMKLVDNTGCKGNMSSIIDCLRSMDASELIDNEPTVEYNTIVFRPTVDGKIVPRMPTELWDLGKLKFTDLLLGTTRDEGTMFLSIINPFVFQVTKDEVNPNEEIYMRLLIEFLKDEDVAKLVQYEYSSWIGLNSSHKVLQNLKNTVGDYFFTCNTNTMAKMYAEHGNNVYKYFFVHPAPSSYAPDWFGAFHGADLHYIFGDVFDFRPTLGNDDIKFAQRMMRYIGNFARTGNPNLRPDGTLEEIIWPRHSPSDRQYLILSPNSTAVGKKLHEKHCSFWDNYLPFISNRLGYKFVNT